MYLWTVEKAPGSIFFKKKKGGGVGVDVLYATSIMVDKSR